MTEERLRALEQALARYRDEDTDLHREIARLVRMIGSPETDAA